MKIKNHNNQMLKVVGSEGGGNKGKEESAIFSYKFYKTMSKSKYTHM